jgi:hypothetical protein
MTTTQIFLLVMVAAIWLVATIVGVRRSRKKHLQGTDKTPKHRQPGAIHPATPKPESSRPSLPSPSGQAEALRQRLRLPTMYDEAKIDRLIQFERDEQKRKGEREAAVENLMERAIERLERDNR